MVYCDEVLDRVHLRGKVALILHADCGKGEFVAVLRGIFFRARLHLPEELICQRFHHQPDFRLVLRKGRHGRQKQAASRQGRGPDDLPPRVGKGTPSRRRYKLNHLFPPIFSKISTYLVFAA